MALIGSESRCAICHGYLDRPFTATSGVAFPPGHRLYEYCDAALHFDCLAAWPDRQEFSRGYFLGTLAYAWRGSAPLLRATARWLLTCGPPGPGGHPHYTSVLLRDWPFRLYSSWADWTEFVDRDYRGELVGPALEAAVAVMAEVREVAPTVAALEALLQRVPLPERELRSYEEFGEFLRTLWGEEADQTNWRLLDAAERASKQRLEEKQRARALEISESNARAQELLHDLETGGSLVCPRCHERSDRIRFIDRGTAEKSYFVCGLCGRSFAGIEES